MFPKIKQPYKMDCGPTCLRIILAHYKVRLSNEKIKEHFSGSNATTFLELSKVAEKLGLEARGTNLTLMQLREAKFPCIAYWNQQHFVVVYKIGRKNIYVSDPGPGLLLKYSHEDFLKSWFSPYSDKGYVLLLSPTKQLNLFRKSERRSQWGYIWKNYFLPFKTYFSLIAVGMGLGLILSLLVPYFTKAIVDVGINNKDLSLINLILLAQLLTSVSSVILGAIRNWIFLYMGQRMNITVVSDFIKKIMRLPLSFFDSSKTGDLLQRVNDHATVRSFASAQTLSMVFSFLNLLVFGVILFSFNTTIFLIFCTSSTIYAIWVMQFLKVRKDLDYKIFERNATTQNSLIQMLQGIRDIKLNNLQEHKQQEWVDIQTSGFKISRKQLTWGQYQQTGAFLIDLFKTIGISYLTATYVIDGKMTLGEMLSVQYILGQLNVPFNQFVGFTNSLQDAKISMERIRDIYDYRDESAGNIPVDSAAPGVRFKDVSFAYSTLRPEAVLKNINLFIPQNKVTAIVGPSGSGKSTIIKLLLRFHETGSGKILIGDKDLADLSLADWRNNCTSVLQDSFIFTDTYKKNIGFGADQVNETLMLEAARLANIHDHISGLPDGYETLIGTETNSLSQGQKQRLLIARAIYKDSAYVFLDEPTSALDGVNEESIMRNLNEWFKGRTVVIVAHKMNTIINADQILVMDKGYVKELGTHEELLGSGTLYRQLIGYKTFE